MEIVPNADLIVADVNARLKAGETDAALTLAVQALALHPNDLATATCLARCYMAANRHVAGLFHLHRAEAQQPDDIDTLLLLGESYNRLDERFESERYYRKALAIKPDHVMAMVELEQIIREQGRYDEVREILGQVRTILPKIENSVATSLAMLDLSQGKLYEGFQGYEKRYVGFKHLWDAYGEEIYPRWTGKDNLRGKSIIMRYEQGLGDTVQFARYANTLKLRFGASEVAVLCKENLHRLIKRVPGVDVVCAKIENEFQHEVMMMSMPAILGTSSESDIPNEPYMSVDPEDAVLWAERLRPFQKPRVGLVWSGELKKYRWDQERMNLRRSIKLELLRPLLDANCDFFALQKGEPEADLKTFIGRRPINNLMNHVKDFYDTACLIANLDMVITVDTSTAHVAGAMGKPVWMLSRLDGDWRWMQDRSDSPWYPSMTIFRQDTFCDWRPTIKRLAADLMAKY